MSIASATLVQVECHEATQRAPLSLRTAVLLSVALPFLGFLAGIILFWGHGVSWLQLGIMLGMYLVTAMGVTAGFHRLFTHRSFETIGPIKLLLGVMGSMAVQGPLIKWVAVHRRHHHHSDTEGDPHSPHLHGTGVLAMLRGIWHAHTGWLFAADAPDLYRYAADLAARPFNADSQCVVSVVGRAWSGDPCGVGRLADRDMVGGFARIPLGRPCPRLSGSPRHLEHQLGLPHLGRTAVPVPRSEPQQRGSSASWASAKAGTTTITRFPPPLGTGSAGGSSI